MTNVLHVPRLKPWLRVLAGAALSVCVGSAWAGGKPAPRSVAFYYGHASAHNELSRFDVAVVEPDASFSPDRAQPGNTKWLAYVSVGEVSPLRSYYRDIPKSWIVGRNAAWQSEVIDQNAPGWPAFFVERVIAPLWKKGYRGFFLDTLDSYQLVAKDDKDRLASQQGLIKVIRAMRARFPEAMLIMNRGFELLPDVHDHVHAVAFESLFKGWDQARTRYTDVPHADRVWLLQRAKEAKEQFGLPVIAIDYCPPSDANCSVETARRIRNLGFIPYIGDGGLQHVNLGSLP